MKTTDTFIWITYMEFFISKYELLLFGLFGGEIPKRAASFLSGANHKKGSSGCGVCAFMQIFPIKLFPFYSWRSKHHER